MVNDTNMGKSISIERVHVEGALISVRFSVSAGLQPYFSDEKSFVAEYSESLNDVPVSIAVIPFIADVLPIVWLSDAELVVPELDQTFYESISEIKQGYETISPMLSFRGKISVKKVVTNDYVPSAECGVFFSGGLDAYATLLMHISERPRLISLWGSDVKLTDEKGWSCVRQNVEAVAREFQLEPPIFVKTNFRTAIVEQRCEDLVTASPDQYWHGYQHGLAIIGHAAPVAYKYHMRVVYIASSFSVHTPKRVICASDPRIDNHVRFAATKVSHDLYDYTRQEKAGLLVRSVQKLHKRIQLHVCWISGGGKNCCHCEKCYRTIFELLAEGANPAEYGFDEYDQYLDNAKDAVMWALSMGGVNPYNWYDIRRRFRKTKYYQNDPRINWVYHFDRPRKNISRFGFVNRLYHLSWKIINVFR